ncbi:DNA polymerase III subunit delta [Streptococcus ruminantium]|uniref:DNA polymerase III subunit delta n=1 Tax=Streptococcus ruminantium TaxID=1917441 RepID=A0ABU1B5M3_9STRE|nr:DNA polymerase III subunit delta [Streptococcus ruminantium]MDQ8759427.1 DNA polymerase III subunit delta [Streptococcus ruminantium]MDQ8764995.1 DNA polymerase III subunit delta [Streptococcus ruminantium]MDQ8769508.1 DNA polymerase III subunit delta [Streptococcus ruminantium]MDQ8775311.1 DNA polymerase III subunit delta [Streptococcus ruminantium]MDQ8793520.1 DNA polymerase III subunit delta [Streptococcus ruminantium]
MTVIGQIEQVKRENLGLLTVLCGEDVGQYQIAKELLLRQIDFSTADLGFAYFDMSEAEYCQVDLDLVSLPFFSDEKVVILDYFSDMTTDKKRYLTDDELKQFEAYLENPVETTRLVILAPGKLDSKRRLVKLLKRDGLILEANPLKEADLKHYFQKEVCRIGLQMDADVFHYLLGKSNFDFAEVSKNLAFLQSYKGQEPIFLADIDAAIPKTLQDNIFDLTQLVLQSKMDQARNLVRDLRLQGEEEIKLIAIMLTQFRTYLQVQILQAQGRGEQQIVVELSEIMGRKVNPFQVKYALRDSRHLSIGFLKKAIKLLIETDFQMKTGQFDKEYLFDLALLKIATT